MSAASTATWGLRWTGAHPLRAARLAWTLEAARQAVAQSGLDFGGDLGFESGVVLGTAAGGIRTWEESYRAVFAEGRNRVPPLVVPRMPLRAWSSLPTRRRSSCPSFLTRRLPS